MVIALIVFFAIFSDSFHRNSGTLVNSAFINKENTVSGSLLVWAFFENLNDILANYATLGLNIADFSHYAKKPRDTYIQFLVIPFIFTVVGLLGIFTAAAAEFVYSKIISNLIFIIEH